MKGQKIDPQAMTVNEAIRRFPATIAVFHSFGLDACCGGAVPIAEAALRHRADPDRLVEALERAIERAIGERDAGPLG